MTDWDAASVQVLRDSAPLGILVTDGEMNIRAWNRWLEIRSGHLATKVLGRNLLDIYPDLVDRGIDDLYRGVLCGQVRVLAQRDHSYLLPMPAEGGSTPGSMLQDARMAPLVRDDLVIGAITIIEDVTERVRRETDLRESRERYRAISDLTSDIVFALRVEPEGAPILEWATGSLAGISGVTRDDVNDLAGVMHLVHSDDLSALRQCIQHLLTGQPTEDEFRFIARDGQMRRFCVRGQPVWDEDHDRVVRIYGAAQDTTEQWRAEHELEQYRVRFDALASERTADLVRANQQVGKLRDQVRRDAQELEGRVTERTRELSALYDVTSVTSESLDLQEMLERVLKRVLEAMRCEVGTLQLLDATGESLCLAAHWGMPPDVIAQFDTLPAREGQMGAVLEHNAPLVVSDLGADPRVAPAARIGDLLVFAGSPLRAHGQTLGVLGVYAKAGRQFRLEDVALLASIADHVGVAVESDRLRRRAEQAAVLEERERLARELHDAVSQSLYSLTLFAQAAQDRAMDGNLDRMSTILGDIVTTANQALKEMRLMLYQLRPSLLTEQGLVEALCHRLEAVEGRVNVKGRIQADGALRLSAPMEEGLYRIAEEALNNTLKHAEAASVTIQIRTEGEVLILEILDDGRGFDPDAVDKQAGMGLSTMRQRAEAMGGSLTIASAPGEGTSIKVNVKCET